MYDPAGPYFRRLPGITQYPNDNLIGPSTERGDYTEISINLPQAPPKVCPDVYQVPLLQWNNESFCINSERSRELAIGAVNDVVSKTNIPDRAIVRFSLFMAHYRLAPLDSTLLSLEEQWIPPKPFSQHEQSLEYGYPTLFITSKHIKGIYFPEQYYGIRQAFKLVNEHYWDTVACRGQRVILGNVVGDNVTYRITRIRFIQDSIVGLEAVGITKDGRYHGETSLGWPPILIELPLINVLRCSFGPSGGEKGTSLPGKMASGALTLEFLY